MWYTINKKGHSMSDTKFYDGTKVLSLKDLDGNTPEIIMVTSNRNAGKTTYFNRYVFNKWVKKREKFIVLVRFSYELDNIHDRFFKDIRELFFPTLSMTSKGIVHNKFRELYVYPNGQSELQECCGYCIALNDANVVKNYSHLFSDAVRCVFDEFQSETNRYCTDEITKFRSVHTSLARGRGKQVKFLPVIMMANNVSIINPYFTSMGISSRLTTKTKFLRGHGFILECGFNESASKANKSSGFNAAFVDQTYTKYSAENVYLNDNSAFVEKMVGRSTYLCTLRYNNIDFAIRSFDEQGIVYCDKNADTSFPIKLCVTTEDHNINYVMLKSNDMLLIKLRYFFNKGCFRFKDLESKECVLSALSY